MKALINKIIPCSFIDGPGSRMTVFFQGCNMHCLYCHNPETQNRCIHCGECLAVCPSGALSRKEGTVRYQTDMCLHCDRCLALCPNFSTPKCTEMTIGELEQQIKRNAAFIDGITLSGGEATLQAGFIVELFRKIKELPRLTTFLDTNGLIGDVLLPRFCDVTDGFMVDLKALDSAKHQELTGNDNAQVLKTIRILGKTDLLYEVRTVIVPGYTDSSSEVRDIATLVCDLNDYTRLKLIPFRPLGVKTRLREEPPLEEGIFQKLFAGAQGILGERAVS